MTGVQTCALPIYVSDGVLADLDHVCRASGVGAEINVDALPASDALIALFDREVRRELQAAGGDDYELCFTAAKTSRLAVQDATDGCDVPVTRIGRIVAAANGLRLHDAEGCAWVPPRRGYVHFGDAD